MILSYRWHRSVLLRRICIEIEHPEIFQKILSEASPKYLNTQLKEIEQGVRGA